MKKPKGALKKNGITVDGVHFSVRFKGKFHIIINSGAPARAKRARSGAPWVRKFGKLSIPENLVMT